MTAEALERTAEPVASGPELWRFSPREQARIQLLTIFSYGLDAGEWIEVRCLDTSVTPAAPGPREYFRSVNEVVTAALKHRDRWDVFFGVATRRCPNVHDIRQCKHRERGKSHIARLTVAWGDFDVASEQEPDKPYADLSSLLETLDATDPVASAVVGSGHGAHGYWSLGSPTNELERVEGLNRSIRARLAGDNAIDAARILRVAGTYSYKHGTRLPVQLLRCERVH